MMTKRSCSHEKEGQEPRGFARLKKKVVMMKKATMTITVFASYTQERTALGSKTIGGGENIRKQMQAKTKNKTTKTCDDGKKVLFN